MIDDGSNPAWMANGAALANALRGPIRRAVAILSLRPGDVPPAGLEGEVLVRVYREDVDEFRADPLDYIERQVLGWNGVPEPQVRSAIHLLCEVHAGRAVMEWHYVGGEA